MATKDCIDFINGLDLECLGLTKGLKWKRLSKRKDEDKNEIREFESNRKDKILIKEDVQTGAFSILKIEIGSQESLVPVKASEKKEKKALDLDVLFKNPINLEEKFIEFLEKNVRDTSDIAIPKDNDVEDFYMTALFEYKNFFEEKNNVTVAEQLFDYDFVKEIGVMFDTENVFAERGYLSGDKKKAYPVVIGSAGGDWEMPVCFAIYWDEPAQRVRLYIPKEEFNFFNRQYMTAYGSEENTIFDISPDVKSGKVMDREIEKQNKYTEEKVKQLTIKSLEMYLAQNPYGILTNGVGIEPPLTIAPQVKMSGSFAYSEEKERMVFVPNQNDMIYKYIKKRLVPKSLQSDEYEEDDSVLPGNNADKNAGRVDANGFKVLTVEELMEIMRGRKPKL